MNNKKHSKDVKILTSLEELRAAYNLPPLRRQTRDKKKLESQRQFFLSKHKCPACETEMVYVEDTNVMYCPNKDCGGFKRVFTDEETEETTVDRSMAFDILDEKGAKIANNIFAEMK